MDKLTKSERKEYVKEQRAKLRANPKLFLMDEIVTPTIRFWKEQPLRALGTFIMWVAIYYLAFGFIQAVNNDMIYCDCTIDRFDGKLMYTYNDFVSFYNNEVSAIQSNPQLLADLQEERKEQNYPIININISDLTTNTKTQQDAVDVINRNYEMICNYDLERWWNEPIGFRAETIWYNFKKIILKRS